MKRGMDFFGTPKRRLRVQCHVDGVSIPGVGSMRLSNIPNNLWNMSNLLLTFGKKFPSVLFYTFSLCAMDVRGDDCQEPGSTLKETNLYLNYTQGDAFLWIKSKGFIDLIFTNNACDFLIAEKQPGNYIFNGCACTSTSLFKTSYDAFLYGQNITAKLINCIEEQLQCKPSPLGFEIIGGAMIGGTFLCCCCIYIFNRRIQEVNRRNEEKILLNSETPLDLKQPLFNSILDKDPPTELPTENNHWCCFHR